MNNNDPKRAGINTTAIVEHAIAAALSVAANLASDPKGAAALVAIGADNRLAGRAAVMIKQDIWSLMVDGREPTPQSFKQLCRAVAALARES